MGKVKSGNRGEVWGFFCLIFSIQGWSSITVDSITKVLPLDPGNITEKEGLTLIRKGFC